MPKNTSAAGKVAAGLGVAALAAGAAAAYYFSGPTGKKHRRDISSWTKKAKTEMVAKIKQMNHVSKAAYEQAAKEILAKYKQAKNIDPAELVALGRELKGHWDKISREVAKLGAKSRKAGAAAKRTRAGKKRS
jgi:hypothetical protein